MNIDSAQNTRNWQIIPYTPQGQSFVEEQYKKHITNIKQKIQIISPSKSLREGKSASPPLPTQTSSTAAKTYTLSNGKMTTSFWEWHQDNMAQWHSRSSNIGSSESTSTIPLSFKTMQKKEEDSLESFIEKNKEFLDAEALSNVRSYIYYRKQSQRSEDIDNIHTIMGFTFRDERSQDRLEHYSKLEMAMKTKIVSAIKVRIKKEFDYLFLDLNDADLLSYLKENTKS